MLKHLRTLINLKQIHIPTRPWHKDVRYKPINKLLVANRGEIACRILRTARRLGIRTVAVYSEADQKAMHTTMADEAYCVGESASAESYLRCSTILNVAKRTKCHAIHPGYGFLSENYEFAEMCEKEGVIFIGPPPSAIHDMGIKSTSKAVMSAAGVPIIAGYHGEDQRDERLVQEAEQIGYPVMIKAIRGGGGKGMRVAESSETFLEALNSARTESQKAFGDSSVLLEKFIRSPRHVEVQVFGDHHGNCVYLFERDCSVQRRHQKIIEEAPAPGITDDLRRALGEAGVRAAKAVGYVGAGTVEFILDKLDHKFHFMEMNTRLQVEHPITEFITNTDLVEWQIRVASGEPLPLNQEQIQKRGHSFEARIYAETPKNNFLPAAGVLKLLSTPRLARYVRIETGVKEGDEVSVHYDPMIAKLIVWGENRNQALNLLVAKLAEYHISGVDTNINFLINLASHPEFKAGNVHTGFIEEHHESLFPQNITDDMYVKAAAAIFLNEDNTIKRDPSTAAPPDIDAFIESLRYRMNHDFVREYYLEIDGQVIKLDLKSNSDEVQIRMNGGEWKRVRVLLVHCDKKCTMQVEIDGAISSFNSMLYDNKLDIFTSTGRHSFKILQPKFLAPCESVELDAKKIVFSPMPGILEKVLVKTGDQVRKGDHLAVIMAMKMEHILKAPRDGIVKDIGAKEGDNVLKGKPIIHFEEDKAQ